jgi:hypothetical protein
MTDQVRESRNGELLPAAECQTELSNATFPVTRGWGVRGHDVRYRSADARFFWPWHSAPRGWF